MKKNDQHDALSWRTLISFVLNFSNPDAISSINVGREEMGKGGSKPKCDLEGQTELEIVQQQLN
jgi:hypothetical protein